MKITNRQAPYTHTILDRFEAGVILAGPEVKSLRGGHAKLEGSFVRIIGSEAYLVNSQIFPYIYARPEGYDPKRTRKLLLHKKEIIKLKSKLEGSNLTLIPLSWYTTGQLMKLEIGICRGKKQYEKREAKRQADIQRDLELELRGKIT